MMINILREAGKPMRSNELISAIRALGKPVIKNAAIGGLYRSIKMNRKQFKQLGPGLFGLYEWKTYEVKAD